MREHGFRLATIFSQPYHERQLGILVSTASSQTKGSDEIAPLTWTVLSLKITCQLSAWTAVDPDRSSLPDILVCISEGHPFPRNLCL